MMPDGQYTLNPTSLANAIKKDKKVLWEFLGGKSPQAQACKDFEMLEIEGVSVEGRGNRIKPIPLYVASVHAQSNVVDQRDEKTSESHVRIFGRKKP